MKTSPINDDKILIEWTGLSPQIGLCPGVRPDGRIYSLPLLNLNSSREEVLNYFNNSWALTEVLFQGLSKKEAFYRRPYHQLRHPLIFYYAHPAVVYVNKLRVAGVLEKAVHSEFEQLFEVGVDEMRWDDLHEGRQDIWPDLELVTEYRKSVYQVICRIIQTHPMLDSKNLPITQKSPLWALVMGFEHERIHFETSSVLMRELPLECVRKPKYWPLSFQESVQSPEYGVSSTLNKMIEVPESSVSLGKPNEWPSFGWDNEYGHEIKECPAFFASDCLVSNAEFKEFVQAAGYSSEKYWSSEGWAWRSFRNIKAPSFWVPSGPGGLHQYQLRTIFEVIEMPWDWPVCVNFHEAKAYCAWKSEKEKVMTPYRLLREVEQHAIRDVPPHLSAQDVKADLVLADENLSQKFNLNLSSGSECSVRSRPANRHGFYDSFGNVWQWSEDTFHPLTGSEPHPYYEDFSAPCYDGKHQMIFGGSFVSTGDEASIWARFHFRPHFFQHAGFRLARSQDALGSMSYESQEMLNKYLLMHWGSDEEIYGSLPKSSSWPPPVVHLPTKCAELVAKFSTGRDSALDLGCAVGRSSFELSRHFNRVLGVDYSREFIEAAQKIKSEDLVRYWRKDSGDQGTWLTCRRDPNVDIKRLTFMQGDACALPSHVQSFDAVLFANVLCRLKKPKQSLERMQGPDALVKPGGILVMTTPFSWLEEYTANSDWIRGISEVQKILSDFDLIHEEELPFMIREHGRKYEYIVTKASVWRRKI